MAQVLVVESFHTENKDLFILHIQYHSWLLMPWLLASPGHQQSWYWSALPEYTSCGTRERRIKKLALCDDIPQKTFLYIQQIWWFWNSISCDCKCFFFLWQQLAELKKENFNLKLRIYFLEEKMQQTLDEEGEDLFKTVSGRNWS